MTQDTKRARRLAPLPAATLGALLLAGCSSGHIGESWQCPLAEGGSCDSVAAADPAVPDSGGRTVLKDPLWQVRDSGPEAPAEPPCEADCGGGFDPFAWLARLFGNGEEAATGSEGPPAPTVREADAAASSAAPETAEPATVALPVERASAQDSPDAGDLRTGEVVARIWIAPFVDGNGVYREASHVRVVLEPAGWRLR